MERILTVDDMAFIRTAFSRRLSEEGYECETAPDGDSALALLDEKTFALVLLDINMPGKSGVDVLREITERHPDTAVIMITATDDTQMAIELMKMGAFDYIIKPVNLSELPVRVRRALDRRRLALENKEYRAGLEDKVRQQTRKIRASFLNSVKSLALALEAKDEYTSGHSQRVADITADIALNLGMDAGHIEKVKFAALVHDIGKIGIKESVMNKKENLTDEEYAHISTHAVTGQKILTPVVEDVEIIEMVRHHHERYDGKGYPDAICGEEIPRGARIIAVADMYDAMTSDRPYRKAVNREIALSELKRQAGTQFDPVIVDAFSAMMKNKPAPVSVPAPAILSVNLQTTATGDF